MFQVIWYNVHVLLRKKVFITYKRSRAICISMGADNLARVNTCMCIRSGMQQYVHCVFVYGRILVEAPAEL